MVQSYSTISFSHACAKVDLPFCGQLFTFDWANGHSKCYGWVVQNGCELCAAAVIGDSLQTRESQYARSLGCRCGSLRPILHGEDAFKPTDQSQDGQLQGTIDANGDCGGTTPHNANTRSSPSPAQLRFCGQQCNAGGSRHDTSRQQQRVIGTSISTSPVSGFFCKRGSRHALSLIHI